MKENILAVLIGVVVTVCFVWVFDLWQKCPDCPEYEVPELKLILYSDADSVKVGRINWEAEYKPRSWLNILDVNTVDSAWIWFGFKSDSIPEFKIYFRVDTVEKSKIDWDTVRAGDSDER